MLKRFNASEDVAGRQNVKSSVQRGIKGKILETFPKLDPYLEEIIPKKSQLSLVKWYPLPPFISDSCVLKNLLLIVGIIFRYWL